MSISLSPSTAKGLLKQLKVQHVPQVEVESYLADMIKDASCMPLKAAQAHAHSLIESLLLNAYNNKHNN